MVDAQRMLNIRIKRFIDFPKKGKKIQWKFKRSFWRKVHLASNTFDKHLINKGIESDEILFLWQ